MKETPYVYYMQIVWNSFGYPTQFLNTVRPDMRYCFRSGRFHPNLRTKHISVIPREFAEHALRIKPNTKPVKQALRRFSEPKRRAIGEEVNRLLDAQFI